MMKAGFDPVAIYAAFVATVLAVIQVIQFLGFRPPKVYIQVEMESLTPDSTDDGIRIRIVNAEDLAVAVRETWFEAEGGSAVLVSDVVGKILPKEQMQIWLAGSDWNEYLEGVRVDESEKCRVSVQLVHHEDPIVSGWFTVYVGDDGFLVGLDQFGKDSKRKRFRRWLREQWVGRRLAIIVAAVILVAGGIAIWWFATASERACDRFQAAVEERVVEAPDAASREIVEEVHYENGTVTPKDGGEPIERPDGCFPP